MKTRLDVRRFKPDPTPLSLILLSALLVIVFFLLQGDVGLNLPDEGFLWYGTIRTALGEVPVRDFQSYDPGRYYWGALWCRIIGSNGLMALRISQAIFQFLGLSLALLLVRRVLNSWLPLVVAGAALSLWMFLPMKIYEPVITIVAVYFGVLLIENPSKKRHFAAGIFVGLAAFFGRNHGVYCSVAFLLLILFVWWKIDRRTLVGRLAALISGIVVGYSPMLFMMAFVPGFFDKVVDGILFNLYNGTNLPLAVPWPWHFTNQSHTLKEWINRFAIGVSYLAFPAFYLLAIVALLVRSRIRANAVLIASTFVGVAYLHYTFDRPHLYYLAWTVPPFILGLIAVPYSFSERHRKKVAAIVWSFLLVLSWTSAGMTPENFSFIKVKEFAKAKLLRRHHGDFGLAMHDYNLVRTDVRGDMMWIQTDIAEIVNNMKAVNNELIPANDAILIAPYWPALYPILRKQSPLWEIYFLFPQAEDVQKKEVEDLERKQIGWALVCHFYLDERPELAFEYTHKYVWQYLVANFQTIQTDQTNRLGRDCELMHRVDRQAPLPSNPFASPGPPQ